jgi:hypothetical protein
MASTGHATAATRTAQHSRSAQRPVLDWTIDRLMAVLAVLMLPGGAVAIGLAWYGAAHTPFLFEQLPYLISGGMLGIGMLVAGGLLYIGSWLSKLADVQRDESAQVRDALAGLRDDLRNLPPAVGAALQSHNGSGPAQHMATAPGPSIWAPAPVQHATGAQATFAATKTLVATRTGTMFHAPGCSVVTGRDDLRQVTGDEPGMKACKLCQPLGVRA